MSPWAVAVVCAVVGGVLGLFVPAGIALLPEPRGERPTEDGEKERYADLARRPGLAPGSGLASAVAAGAVGLHLGADRALWALVPLVPVLVLLAIVDWRTRLLPRVVVLPATGVAVALLLVEWIVVHETHVLLRAAIAGLVARSFFWILWFVKRAGMGFGDVRLAALVGLVLGRLGWDEWLVGLYGGLLLFAVWGVGRAVVRHSRAALKQALPYGPFLILGLGLGVLTSGTVSLFG